MTVSQVLAKVLCSDEENKVGDDYGHNSQGMSWI